MHPTIHATDSTMQAVLSLHNSLRARHAASPLSWSESLAAASQQWADQCVMEHGTGSYGENLAMGYPAVDAVQVREVELLSSAP